MITFTGNWMEQEAARPEEPEAAWQHIQRLIELEKVFGDFFRKWEGFFPADGEDRVRFYLTFERTLQAKALSYTAGSSVTGRQLTDVIELASRSMPNLGQQCLQTIEKRIAEGIRTRRIPDKNRIDLYKAASVTGMDPELQQAYELGRSIK